MMWPFSKPKPTITPVVIIRNVLGEELDRLEGWDLSGQDLRGKQWEHADLSGLSLDGANCEHINLFGAKLVRTSFCRANLSHAELSFSDATSGNFAHANMDGCFMYRSETRLARFDDAIITETTDVPGIKVVNV